MISPEINNKLPPCKCEILKYIPNNNTTIAKVKMIKILFFHLFIILISFVRWNSPLVIILVCEKDLLMARFIVFKFK